MKIISREEFFELFLKELKTVADKSKDTDTQYPIVLSSLNVFKKYEINEVSGGLLIDDSITGLLDANLADFTGIVDYERCQFWYHQEAKILLETVESIDDNDITKDSAFFIYYADTERLNNMFDAFEEQVKAEREDFFNTINSSEV